MSINQISDKEKLILKLIFKEMKPKPKTNVLEFAKRYGKLSGESSAVTGRFVPFPFQEKLLKVMSDDNVELVVAIKATRTGFTKTINFSVAYHIAEEPSPQKMFVPNDGKAKEWVKAELIPMLNDMPIIRDCIYKTRLDDNLLRKAYPGGYIAAAGLQTENNAASVTLRIIYVDEADRVPSDLGGEGDTFALLSKRLESYHNGKMVIGSTPTIKGHSNIETKFEETDKEYRYYPCPFCNHFQILDFKNLKWDKEYREGVKTHLTHTAYFECESCKEKIYQTHHRKMDKKARWRQTQAFFCCGEWQDPKVNENWFYNEDDINDDRNGEALCIHCNTTAEYNRIGRKKLGFHMWSAMGYHAQSTWAKIAEAFVNAIGNVDKMRAFKNTWLAESFEEDNIKLDKNKLIESVEHYSSVPEDAKVLLMTVDTQNGWLEYVITAWCDGETSYNMQTGKIEGDPINKWVWDELLRIKRTPLKMASGKEVYIYHGFVDMGGGRTDEVKKFVRANINDFKMLKGDDKEAKHNDSRPVAQKKISQEEKDIIMWVATNKAKDIIFERLAKLPNEAGYIHHNNTFSEEWFNQVTSEKKTFKKNKKGYIEGTYEKTRERNEALDLLVYQLAAIRLVQQETGINLQASEDLPKIEANK